MSQDALEFDVVEPEACALIESLRAYGYTPATAVADIIDNSISAGAKNVWLNFHWSGPDSFISILDDGKGMNESVLLNAMRPGSSNPLDQRDPSDLGRFGIGLKSASFSQCRRLTVASRTIGGLISVRRWDLDHVAMVKKWHLLKSAFPGSEQRLTPLDGLQSGTIVLLESLDRIVNQASAGDRAAHQRFLNLLNDIEEYLAMVFHRYIEEPRARLRIFINGTDDQHRIEPWDPFLITHTATVASPAESIKCGDGTITVQGFVLPHKDRLGDSLHKCASGPFGWNAQQGFYVYRNERLLVPGSWLRLGNPRPWTKEEHYKLARLRLDIPNSLDMDWQIDVKKSTARPPAIVRGRLRQLADEVRRQARDIFAHRGSYGARERIETVIRAWSPVRSGGRIHYKIDRHHPLVRYVLDNASDLLPSVKAMLRTLEETVPAQRIWLDTAEQAEMHSRPFELAEEDEVRDIILTVLRALMTNGIRREQALPLLLSMEAFLDYHPLIERIIKEQ